MISAAGGTIWLICLGISGTAAVVIFIIQGAFIAWGLYEAAATHETLAEARSELLKEIRVVR